MRTFRNFVTALPDVSQMSYSMSGPPQSGMSSQTMVRFDSRPNEELYTPQQTWIDPDYVGLYGLKLVAGRNLQPSDTAREALINETFMHRLGFTQPADVVGKFLDKGDFARLEIVGVLKDFNQLDLKRRISPLFLTTLASGYYAAFVYDQIQQAYQQEQTMSNLINFFNGIALLIGCMGLYELVLFMVVQRTKEVGVRKVLGASIGSILWLFSWEFIRLIGLAFVVSAPVAWWVMNNWLANFEYKISISLTIFVAALLATVVVALLTVSFQSVKAALMNPVKSLRSE